MTDKHKAKEEKIEPVNESDNKENVVSKEAEYLELAQRIKAEFENFKRRNADSMAQSFDNGVCYTVEKLLPVMDSFKQAKNSINDENTIKGLDLILGQITKAFNDLGVTKIDAVDKEFNPNYHNAVLVGNDETKPDGVILQELQEGFIYKNDKVIRHSVVQINKLN